MYGKRKLNTKYCSLVKNIIYNERKRKKASLLYKAIIISKYLKIKKCI